jgi:hypothetical protein
MSRERAPGRNGIGKVRSRPVVDRRDRRVAGRHAPIRRRSAASLFGFPVWEISKGPDLEQGERHGHARALLAVGDVADGVIALGGISRGIVAIGGISLGVFTVGGIAVGLAAAVGGIAAAPFAIGGVAFGIATMGGAKVDFERWRLNSSRAANHGVHRHRSRWHRR